MTNIRRDNAQHLTKLLDGVPGIHTPFDPPEGVHSYFFYQLRLGEGYVTSREQLADQLKRAGIGTSIYYATPLHLMTYYRDKYGYRRGDFPVAETLADCTIALPVGPHVKRNHIERMAEIIRNGATGKNV